MKRKHIKYYQGDTYRIVDRSKVKAKAGQYFLDQQSGKLKEAIAKTAEKFYVYEKIAEGPYYLSQDQSASGATRLIIRDARDSKIALKIYQREIYRDIIDLLNSKHN